MSMTKTDQEVSVIAEVNQLPANMQLIYMQLVSAMVAAITEMQGEGARSDHIGVELIEGLVDKLLQQAVSHSELVELLTKEIDQQLASVSATI